MTNKQKADRYKKAQIVLSVALMGILLIIGLLLWVYRNDDTSPPVQETGINMPDPQSSVPDVNVVTDFKSEELQKVLDKWANSQSGKTSVVIADQSGSILAAKDADQVFFAASIYKLYVAYEGYRQIDERTVDSGEVYLEGLTRGECLDKMIRESYSPCAEKLKDELGALQLTNKLKTYGILNTSMTEVSTTAADAVKILSIIENGDELSKESRAKYLESMRTQEALYRSGLPKGFSAAATVYDKVGWDEYKEWHDASIVVLPDGRTLIVSVFTENVGSRNVAKLGTLIEAATKN